MRKLLAAAVAIAALALTAGAVAAVPTRTTDVRSLSFVDDEECGFPRTITLERTRTTIAFDNGDEQRHVQLVVTSSANGKTWIERDAYVVFVDADSRTSWTIVGEFTHTRVDGSGTVFLESGRIAYDLVTDTITDLHQGPHGTGADPDEYAAAVCAALAP